MIVVKIGGSLFDHPRLGAGLCHLDALAPSDVLLVPGGGARWRRSACSTAFTLSARKHLTGWRSRRWT